MRASILFGFLLLAGGLWLYVDVSPSWAQAQSWLTRAALVFDPKLQAQVDQVRQTYYLSLMAMVGGGVLLLLGLAKELGRRRKP